MSFVSKAAQKITKYISPRKPASHNLDGDTITVQSPGKRKRGLRGQSPSTRRKKPRLSHDTFDADDSDIEGSTLLTSARRLPKSGKQHLSMSKKEKDNVLMPPPAAPGGRHVSKTPSHVTLAASLQTSSIETDEDEMGLINETPYGEPVAQSCAPSLEEVCEEQQARYKEAMQLPENSGIWTAAEKDLFYRLALRGFEPLLPENWMTDFRTLPISIYSRGNAALPLIQAQSGCDFRAIRALRELLETGSRVRDRALADHRLRPEPRIASSVKRYLSWALYDAQVHPDQRPRAVPVHAVVMMQKGKSTQDAIIDMTVRLHHLAARHRMIYDIQPSIESRRSTPVSNDETQVVDDEDQLPILTGLIICSSLVVVVTLNVHALPPASLVPSQPGDQPPNPEDSQSRPASLEDAKEESGLRFIATFDFSESGMDVWNALAVAIVALHIRKMMIQHCEQAQATVDTVEGGRWELLDRKRRATELDPDA